MNYEVGLFFGVFCRCSFSSLAGLQKKKKKIHIFFGVVTIIMSFLVVILLSTSSYVELLGKNHKCNTLGYTTFYFGDGWFSFDFQFKKYLITEFAESSTSILSNSVSFTLVSLHTYI